MIRSLNNLKEQMCASWEDESQAESQKLLRTSTRRQPNSQNLYTIQRIYGNFKISVIAMIHLSTVYNFSCSIFDSLIWSSDDSWLWSFQRKLQILLDRSWHFTGRMNWVHNKFQTFFWWFNNVRIDFRFDSENGFSTQTRTVHVWERLLQWKVSLAQDKRFLGSGRKNKKK